MFGSLALKSNYYARKAVFYKRPQKLNNQAEIAEKLNNLLNNPTSLDWPRNDRDVLPQ